MRAGPIIIVLTLLLGVSRVSAAPTQADKNRAVELVYAGDDKREAGDHAGALKLYLEADAIMGVPSTGIEVARELIALGRLVEAQAKLEEVEEYVKKPKEPEAFDTARDEARRMLQELSPRIPELRIVIVGGPPSQIRIDGKAVPLPAAQAPIPLDPGEHRIDAQAAGVSDRASITLKEGEQQEITLTLPIVGEGDNAAPETGREISPLVWVGFGVGGAGIIVGAITGGVAFDRTSFLAEDCDEDKVCSSDNSDVIDEAVALSHVSTVSFIIGGAGIALGATMLVVSLATNETSPEAGIMPVIGPGYAGITGSF